MTVLAKRRKLLPWVQLLVFSACLPCMAKTVDAANGTIVFQVSDEGGRKLQGARCRACFVENDSLISQNEVAASTDKDGVAKLSGKTNGEIIFRVEMDGYYSTHGRYWMYRPSGLAKEVTERPNNLYGVDMWPASDDVTHISWGHWIPRERRVFVVLKKKCEFPVMAMKGFRLDRPVPNPEIGVDCQSGDWVEPVGRGILTDAIINFRSGPKGIEVWLLFPPDGEGLLMPLEPWSDWPYVHEAPTSGYQREVLIPPDEVQRWKWGVFFNMRDHYVIFRSRMECDEEGNVITANYGMISRLQCSIQTRRLEEGEIPTSACVNSFQCCFNNFANDRRLE